MQWRSCESVEIVWSFPKLSRETSVSILLRDVLQKMLYVFSRRVLHVSWNAHMSVGLRKDATVSTSSDGKTHNGDCFRRERLNNFNFLENDFSFGSHYPLLGS